jgi:hypothetical protein
MNQTAQLSSLQQLAGWAQNFIDQSRSPFRRAEAEPQLLSAQGVLHPALIFWINRESFMAGGVLLCADQDLPKTLAEGADCAEALGLRHFLTLSHSRIDFWELNAKEPRRIDSLSLPEGRPLQAGHCYWVMQEILEKLKPLSVLGAVPPEQLSPHYLANLCRSPLRITRSELEEAFRRVRVATGSEPNKSIQQLASAKATLVLTRLLALLSLGQLPDAVQPERLEHALELAIPELPPALAQALQGFAGEIPLPHTCAVRFHHLFRRMGQLRWAQDRERAAQTLDILLHHRCMLLGLERSDNPEILKPGALLVNPVQVTKISGTHFEIYQDAGLRALMGLLRELQGLPHPAESLLDIPQMFPQHSLLQIAGSLLSDSTSPGPGEKEVLRLCLRNSWPHRRLHFPIKAPRWVWDAVHLLGLAGSGADVSLDLPDELLDPGLSAPLIEILTEQFTLLGREHLASSRTRLILKKESASDPQQPGRAGHLPLAAAPETTRPKEGRNLKSALDGWLGISEPSLTPGYEVSPCSSETPRERRISPDESQKIIDEVFCDGLPQFPEQYLYEHYRPDLVPFNIQGPLRIATALLGTYELVDSLGNRLQVQGEETAQALILASYGTKRLVHLPSDRHLTAEIVARYFADLAELRRQLLLQTHGRREKSLSARNWAKKIWESLSLPRWDDLPE